MNGPFFFLLVVFMGTNLFWVDTVNNLENDVHSYQLDLSESREKLKSTEEVVAELQREMTAATNEVELLKLENKAKTSELSKAQQQIRASRSRVSLPKIKMGSLNWSALRKCENGGNYTSKSGDSYRGAYQFDQRTWDGIAARHYPEWVSRDPASASPGIQDAFARWLYSERGRQPWPVCGKLL